MGKTLLEKEGVDTDLANILVTHLLSAKPAADAVTQAINAIIKLARERAMPPNAEPQDG